MEYTLYYIVFWRHLISCHEIFDQQLLAGRGGDLKVEIVMSNSNNNKTFCQKVLGY